MRFHDPAQFIVMVFVRVADVHVGDPRHTHPGHQLLQLILMDRAGRARPGIDEYDAPILRPYHNRRRRPLRRHSSQ